MARFWHQMMASGEVAALQRPKMKGTHDTSSIKDEVAKATENSVWHFLELGAGNKVDGTPEVLTSREGIGGPNPKRSRHTNSLAPSKWEYPNEIIQTSSKLINDMLASISVGLEIRGTGMIIVRHSQLVSKKSALVILLSLLSAAAKEGWKVVLVGGGSMRQTHIMPEGPGWMDYLQGNHMFQEIIHYSTDGDAAWIPAGNTVDPNQPLFLKNSPSDWIRQLRRNFSLIIFLGGSEAGDDIIASLSNGSDGFFILSSSSEARDINRCDQTLLRQGLPFLGQVILPGQISDCATL